LKTGTIGGLTGASTVGFGRSCGTLRACHHARGKPPVTPRKRNPDRHPDVEIDREGRAPLLVRIPTEIAINRMLRAGRDLR
jgi:hypothetical protein